MKTFLSAVVLASVSVVFGLMSWGALEKLDAAPKVKNPPPAVYEPTTVQTGELVRVSVVNDDSQLNVTYTVRLIDVQTGAILYQQDIGPVPPLTGVVQDVNVTQNGREDFFVIISGSSDLSTAHPVNLSSVQIVDAATGTVLRHTPHQAIRQEMLNN